MCAKISAKQGEKARKAAVRQGAGGARTGKIEKSRQNTNTKKKSQSNQRHKTSRRRHQQHQRPQGRCAASRQGCGQTGNGQRTGRTAAGKGENRGRAAVPAHRCTRKCRKCRKSTSPVPHQCLTSASPVPHQCLTTFAPQLSHISQQPHKAMSQCIDNQCDMDMIIKNFHFCSEVQVCKLYCFTHPGIVF